MPLGGVLKIMATAAPEQRMALAATLLQDSRGPQILITGIVLTVVMVIVVNMRMHTRAVILRLVGPDDWFILGSTVSDLLQR